MSTAPISAADLSITPGSDLKTWMSRVMKHSTTTAYASAAAAVCSMIASPAHEQHDDERPAAAVPTSPPTSTRATSRHEKGAFTATCRPMTIAVAGRQHDQEQAGQQAGQVELSAATVCSRELATTL